MLFAIPRTEPRRCGANRHPISITTKEAPFHHPFGMVHEFIMEVSAGYIAGGELFRFTGDSCPMKLVTWLKKPEGIPIGKNNLRWRQQLPAAHI